MNRPADLVAEHVVDELVLLDTGQTGEVVRNDLGAEVVAAAVQVLDLNLGAGQGLLDPLLEVIRGRHCFAEVTGGYYLPNDGDAHVDCR